MSKITVIRRTKPSKVRSIKSRCGVVLIANITCSWSKDAVSANDKFSILRVIGKYPSMTCQFKRPHKICLSNNKYKMKKQDRKLLNSNGLVVFVITQIKLMLLHLFVIAVRKIHLTNQKYATNLNQSQVKIQDITFANFANVLTSMWQMIFNVRNVSEVMKVISRQI